MAEREPERPRPKAEILAGSGRRARETGAVLAALAGLDAAGERRGVAWTESGLADLEELFAPHSLEGLLILEAERVPPEDIGFVRRFLERQAGWRLVVVGESEQDARARTLLALARAQWLAWPPDLGELRVLLPVGAARAAEPGLGERPRTRRAAPAERRVNGGVDLGGLLEELLAGAAVRGESTARYSFSAGRNCRIPGEREALLAGLHGLVELARLCAGSDGLVRATLAGDGDAVEIQLEFPRANLPERGLSGLLQGSKDPPDPALAEGLAGARRGAGLLAELGASVNLEPSEPGRVRCEVRFAVRAAPLEPARSGKAEDPFA